MNIKDLYNEDNNIAYKALILLEKEIESSNEIYNNFDQFLNMLNSNKTFIRVRGFRIICSLSKWDKDNKINDNIDIILKELDDPKGTSVRNCLGKINVLLKYKKELSSNVENKLKSLDLSKYKPNMQLLISKDISLILDNL